MLYILPDLSWHKESCDWAAIDLDVACLAWFLNAKAIWKHQLQKDPRQDHRSSDAKDFIYIYTGTSTVSFFEFWRPFQFYHPFWIPCPLIPRCFWHRSPSNFGASQQNDGIDMIVLWQGAAPPCVWCCILCPVRHSKKHWQIATERKEWQEHFGFKLFLLGAKKKIFPF